jgi:thioredoxin-like negative regulator of GroEL
VKSSSGDQQITLAKVDIDKFGELSIKYNVQAVPTGKSCFLLFLISRFTVLAIKNGKEIARFTGVVDEDRIETILDRLNY